VRPGFHLDEQVYVAFGSRLTPRLASEENNSPGMEALDDCPGDLFQQLRIIHVCSINNTTNVANPPWPSMPPTVVS
jgi:hypothetical protein